MPNALVHFAVQGAVTRAVAPTADAKWILLSAVIPDLPWIVQRGVRALATGVDPFDLRLYASVQSSLAFVVLLSGALALVSRRPRMVFAILAGNGLLHLLLDGVEAKWGNGSLLLAPWSWAGFNVGIVWPEEPAIVALSAVGALLAVWMLARPGAAVPLAVPAPRRAVAAAALFAAYLLAPLPLLPAAEAADAHFVQTLRHAELRPGRAAEFDRAQLTPDRGGCRLRAYAGEAVAVDGDCPDRAETVSVRGRFTGPGRFAVEALHVHEPALRDIPSYLGLGLLAVAWIVPLLRSARSN
ncbi:MAG TPA: hypothetical protein VD995_31265 [Azospirillum sp.]|nr:hypothetical protein [Azospirillum sp.]